MLVSFLPIMITSIFDDDYCFDKYGFGYETVMETYARKRKNWNDDIRVFTELDVFRAFGDLCEARRISYREDVVIPVRPFHFIYFHRFTRQCLTDRD